MKPNFIQAVLLASVVLAGCAGGQPTSSGPPKGHEVVYAEKPVDVKGREVHGDDAKDFPALDQPNQAVAQFGVYRIECQSDHKAYLSYGSTDRVLIGDFADTARIFSLIKNSASSSSPIDMVDFFDLSQAISGLPKLLIANLKSNDPIVPLVDLAEQWTSKGSITWRARFSKFAMMADARRSADMRDRLGREIAEHSKRHDVSQTQPGR